MPDLLTWMLSSALLILAVIALRAVFAKRLSASARYALWGLVLLRLLIPGTLFSLAWSPAALTGLGREQPAQIEQAREQADPGEQRESAKPAAGPELASPAAATDSPAAAAEMPPSPVTAAIATEPLPQAMAADAPLMSAAASSQLRFGPAMLQWVWLTGTAVTAAAFIIINLRFRRRLRARRALLDVDCPLPVYVVKDLSSSCLFAGAIYLSSDAATDPTVLCHVLEHELAHHRHGDRLWSLLRCAALILHWYDPLVWWAAALSRQDSELLADAGAICRLGEGVRQSYGQTLIRLSAACQKDTPLLAPVTAMKSRKRDLQERVSHIARPVRRSLTATLAVALLAIALAGCAFSGPAAGAGEPEDPITLVLENDAESPYLSGDEIAYFNNIFFAAPTVLGPSSYVNIHNQFLSSLYASPAEIDLFELFYCGLGYPDAELSEEEWELVGNDVTGTDKLPAAQLDAVLFANTGAHLEETQRIGLDSFEYLPQFDAYYHTHGDTNYRSVVTICGGLREDDLVHLYYWDDFMAGGWKCVTLRQVGDGWHFVSNLEAEKPLLPTVLPAGEPWRTVSLGELQPYAPQEVEMAAHENDCAELHYGFMTENGVEVRIYTATDGRTYAAVVDGMEFDEGGELAFWQARSFLEIPEGAREINMFFFRDLFGRNGLVISFDGEMPAVEGRMNGLSRLYYYYCFSDVGTPTLLASCVSREDPQICDLDGDGENELLSCGPDRCDLFFRRDGRLYRADVYELFTAVAAEEGDVWWDRGTPDFSRRCLRLLGYWRPEEDGEGPMTAFWRYIYFDGSNLRIYEDPPLTVTDHVANTVSAPAQVIADAKAALELDYTREVLDDWADDWCLSCCELTDRVVRRDYELEIYRIEKLFHAQDLSKVMLAGGAYVREDGWVSVSYPCYLVYQVDADGERRLLEGGLPFDIAGEARGGELAYIELINGLRLPTEVNGDELLWLFRTRGPWVSLNLLGSFGEGECTRALTLLQETTRMMGLTDEIPTSISNWPEGERDLTPEGRNAYDYLRFLQGLDSGVPQGSV